MGSNYDLRCSVPREACGYHREHVWEPFPGITIVAWNLPNGFTISDQSGCVDPKNYDREIGVEICLEHLRDKLWMLYGFLLKESLGKAE